MHNIITSYQRVTILSVRKLSSSEIEITYQPIGSKNILMDAHSNLSEEECNFILSSLTPGDILTKSISLSM